MKNYDQLQDKFNRRQNLWNSLLFDSDDQIKQSSENTHIFQLDGGSQQDCSQDKAIQQPLNFDRPAVDMWKLCFEDIRQLEFKYPNQTNGMQIGQFLGTQGENLLFGQFSQKQNNIGCQPPGKLDDSRGPCFSESADEFSSIFREKKIKKSFKKNTNIPKFIVRLYLKHFSSSNKNKKSRIVEFHKKTKNSLKGRVSNNYRITDLLRLFNDEWKPNHEISLNNRKVLTEILRAQSFDQILHNNYIQGNSISYMMALKIYSLRCRSINLIERVKIF